MWTVLWSSSCSLYSRCEENSGLSMCSMYTYCVLQGTDLSLLAHWDRDCIRTREVSNSYQHIAALHVCACVFVLYAHCAMWLQCSPSYHFLYVFVFKFVLVCTLLHAVQRKCSLVMLFECVFVCVRTSQTVLYHTARRRPKWTRTPCDGFGQAETTHTQDIRTWQARWQMLSHTHIHTHVHMHPPADPITQRCATKWKQIYPENQLI